MKIAIDAMGGDFAPAEIVKGAMQYAEANRDDYLYLVGDEARIEAVEGFSRIANLEIVHTAENVAMDEHPAQSVRKKKNCSIRLANRLVKEKKAGAVVSMGNTGACVAGSLFELGRIPGIMRPSVATIFPTDQGGVVLLDMGANVDCTAEQLLQFAQMGSVYAKHVLGRENPSVGLLNIGDEEIKGSKFLIQTHELLKNSPTINFTGNIEGDRIFSSKTDVIVCDGLMGNIVLKTVEGFSHKFMSLIKGAFSKLELAPEKQAAAFKMLSEYSASNPKYSCAPLLGLEGITIIGHGNSDAGKFKDSLGHIKKISNSGMMEKLQKISFKEVSA